MVEPNPRGVSRSPVLGAAAKATAVLASAGMLGQVFALVRELFVASQVGVSAALDALLVAAVAPTMLSSLLVSGVAAAIVPGYPSTVREAGQPAADRLLGAILSWGVLAGLVTMAIITAAAGAVVAVAGPGLDQDSRDLALQFVPILAPVVVLSVASSLLAAVFQIHDRMRLIGTAWVVGPFVSVVVTIAGWSALGLQALALGLVAQQAVTVAVLVVLALRLGILPRPSLRADRTAAGRFIRHAAPLTVSASVLSFNLLIDRAIATLIVPGGASALRYAESLIRIPINAILPAWTAAIYPALVRAAHLERSESLGDAAAGAIRYVTVFFIPLAVATAALAPWVVHVAFVRGAFDARASLLTAGALAGLAPLLFLTMTNSILTGSHNARRRGVFLMSMGILNAILNAVFNVGFGLWLGVAGVALSTSLTMGIVQFIKAQRLGDFDQGFPLLSLIRVAAKSLVASLVIAVPIGLLAWTVTPPADLLVAVGGLVALTIVGIAGYLGTAKLVGLVEPWLVVSALVRAPGRVAARRRR